MTPPADGTRISADVLELDPEAAVDEIVAGLRDVVGGRLRKRGAVVGLSGGIDSSVCAALSVRAFGAEHVLGVLMPESDSAEETLELSRLSASSLGIETVLEDITEILESAGCYTRRDAAIRSVLPDYGEGWKAKIVLPSLLGADRYRLFKVVAESPDGERHEARLTASAYREVVASTNFKQRTRKMLEYHHADRLDYAVVGTPNRLEYDQGFFVKQGDGAADVKPIAHLYKTQVYRLADHLGVPEEIRTRPPTTDTYSLPQSQEEFYFSVPWDKMDLCLYGKTQGLPPEAIADAVGLSAEDVGRVYGDIDAKRRVAEVLHLGPQLVVDDPALDRH
ncbi:MAG: NAD(+) synthase [Gaiellaceae bacterium]